MVNRQTGTVAIKLHTDLPSWHSWSMSAIEGAYPIVTKASYTRGQEEGDRNHDSGNVD